MIGRVLGGVAILVLWVGAVIAAQAADAQAMIAEVVRTGSVIVRGIGFERNTAVPTKESEAAFREVEMMLQEHTEWVFEVQVHTDETGDASRDLELSAARARAIVQRFTYEEIVQVRLVPRGYGSTRPLPASSGLDETLRHRRVEFKKLNEE